jgi:hypothetical protein
MEKGRKRKSPRAGKENQDIKPVMPAENLERDDAPGKHTSDENTLEENVRHPNRNKDKDDAENAGGSRQ